MDPDLIILAYVVAVLFVGLGLPLALGVVPPNRWYGHRSRAAFDSPEKWYFANRKVGWAMLSIVGDIKSKGRVCRDWNVKASLWAKR